MPKLKNRPPAYRHFKPRNLACVTIDGKRVYLGPYGSAESRAEYARLIAEWEQRVGRPHVPSHREMRRARAAGTVVPVPLTVVELVDRYLAWARTYYVKRDGVTPSNENVVIRSSVRPLLKLYATVPARKFRPRHLRSVRDALVDSGRYARKQVNDHVSRIKRMMTWGVEYELIPGSVVERLRCVRGLRRGKTTARDNPPVREVPDAVVERTMAWLPPAVRIVVQFMRLTGCRPGEAVSLRPCDVDMSSEPWCYSPAEHKTQHHGHERRVFIGPKAADVLRPLLLRPSDERCFAKYTKDSLARAIARALARANEAEAEAAKKEEREPDPIPRWTPNMLRHTRATELRRQFGIEAARVALGHSDPGITLVYAEADQKLAAEVARKTG